MESRLSNHANVFLLNRNVRELENLISQYIGNNSNITNFEVHTILQSNVCVCFV